MGLEEHISGEDQLLEKPLDLAATSKNPLAELIQDARRSSRLCECEGRKDMTDHQLNRGKDCGSTSCSGLPMALVLTETTQKLLDKLLESAGTTVDVNIWGAWCQEVLRATKEELRFAEPKKQDIRTVVSQSPFASPSGGSSRTRATPSPQTRRARRPPSLYDGPARRRLGVRAPHAGHARAHARGQRTRACERGEPRLQGKESRNKTVQAVGGPRGRALHADVAANDIGERHRDPRWPCWSRAIHGNISIGLWSWPWQRKRSVDAPCSRFRFRRH
ncbi:hypothetical protein PsYK624_147060 [Phanerochaete sordida]|uniref:Uncharacterized protein n=1 Tax=Phanerochaete sordida TaxID=48140 RepID=A0A9P3GQG0_9APHY|nr:hypothetical protein PsYK624_147060 [Phanerochaete sordida]